MYPQQNIHFNRDISDEIRQAVSSALTSGSLIKYSGRPDQPLLQWLDEFEIHCESKGWRADSIVLHLAQFLTGPALQWYLLTIRPRPELNWQQTRELMTRRFNPTAHQSIYLAHLLARQQKNNEDVLTYCLDKQRLCLLVNTDINECVQHGVHPLCPDNNFRLNNMRPITFSTDSQQVAEINTFIINHRTILRSDPFVLITLTITTFSVRINRKEACQVVKYKI